MVMPWPPIALKAFPFWRVDLRTGARLEFSDASVLPTDFNLTFDAKTLRWCQLKWRVANEVGMSFQRPTKT